MAESEIKTQKHNNEMRLIKVFQRLDFKNFLLIIHVRKNWKWI